MGDADRLKKHHAAVKALCVFLLIFLILAGITLLILWLVYRPTKPKFTVVNLAIYQLNVTSPPFLSTTMQFTLTTRNSNSRVSYQYDHLTAFVSYKNEVITPPVMLPPLFHGTKSTVAISPMLEGGPVPVSVSVLDGLVLDEAYGVVALSLVLKGKLRYKAGAIRSRRYRLYVECDALVGLKEGFVGEVPLLASPSPQCNTDV